MITDTPIPLIRDYRAEQPFVLDGEHTITQERFLRDVQHLAGQLPLGGQAFVLCEDRYHFLLSFCAHLVNGTTNLLPPNRHPTTLEQIAEDHPGCRCLADAPLAAELPITDVRTLIAEDPPRAGLPEIAGTAVAALAFTSGSTGRPKPNRKHWATLCAATGLLSARLMPGDQRRTLVATVPSQHMYGLEMTAMMALQGRCQLHRDKPFYPGEVLRTLTPLSPPVLLVSTPVHLRALVNAGLDMPAVEAVVSATAPLPNELARQSAECFAARMLEVYGCTETGSLATRETLSDARWQPLPGIELSVDEHTGTARAPHLPEPTRLQDQLALEPDGRFRLLGRDADMINVAGKRASLAELTQKLAGLEGVDDAVVFMPDNDRGKAVPRPAALVVSQLSPRAIATALTQVLEKEFIPRPIRKVDQLPRNETGKIPRAALETAWRQARER